MTTIYMVRNAQLEDEQDLSSQLSQKGKLEASKIASFFEGKKIDVCYLSAEKSSATTLDSMLNNKNIQTYVTQEFNERKIGPRVANLVSFTKRQWSDSHYKLAGGESLSETCERVIDGLDAVVTNEENKTCVIGTHSMVMGLTIQFFDETFSIDEYVRTMELSPWIVKMDFEGKTLVNLEEIHCA